MRAIITVILVVIFWNGIGHYFPVINILLTPFFFPLLFFISSVKLKKPINIYLYVPYCFGIVLLNHYLFTILGGGTYDDAGRAVWQLIFYCTLSSSAISLLLLCIMSISKGKIYGIFYVIMLAIITLIIFSIFNFCNYGVFI